MSAPWRALIAEDEAPQREALRVQLQMLWPGLHVQVCADGIEAIEMAEADPPDIAFLDIRMPGANGFDVAVRLQTGTHVVFVTAYDEFAIKAFEAGAIDYLLKPVRHDRLVATIERLKQRLGQPVPALMSDVLASLRAHLQPDVARAPLRWITASLGDVTRLLPVDEVLYFQAQDKYTRVVTAEVEALIRTPLRELLDGLDEQQFWQIHRSVIVRADAVDRVRRDELGKWQLWLRGRDESLPLSAAFQHRFKAM